MENPNKKLTIITIKPEHAGEGVKYEIYNDCAFTRAIRAAGLKGYYFVLWWAKIDWQRVKVNKSFGYNDFLAVRAGKVIEYLYDPDEKTMTRME